ncbi:MAG: DUF1015 domain-containing protein, partial [Actinomycetota bacterium]|nr:DUF1015 domain-containing protein [Actinomycetota bacterium]
GILPHEPTTPKAKSDRLLLLRATRANLSPIWALSPTTGLSDLCEPPEHPAEHAHDDDGVLHELWPINDPDRVAAIRDLVGSAPVLIADGHHRFETALAYQQEQGADAGAGAVMALIVELADDQLAVHAIHRLVSGLPPSFDSVGALASHFDLSPTVTPDANVSSRMLEAQAVTIVTPQGAWLGRPRPETAAAAAHDLDSSRLDAALATWPEHQLRYQHGWDHATDAVKSGDAQMAVLLRPATVSQISAISKGGVRMPPKTTFFWPKPRTGLVIRELQG